MIIIIVINKKISTKTKIHFHGLNHVALLAPLNSFFNTIFEGVQISTSFKKQNNVFISTKLLLHKKPDVGGFSKTSFKIKG